MNPLAYLTGKVSAAIIGALVAAIIGLSITIWGLPLIGGGLLAKLDTARAQLETANAKLTALADESDRRKAEGRRAVEADKPRSAQRQAARTIIIREPGVCDTSSDIAEALEKGWVR